MYLLLTARSNMVSTHQFTYYEFVEQISEKIPDSTGSVVFLFWNQNDSNLLLVEQFYRTAWNSRLDHIQSASVCFLFLRNSTWWKVQNDQVSVFQQTFYHTEACKVKAYVTHFSKILLWSYIFSSNFPLRGRIRVWKKWKFWTYERVHMPIRSLGRFFVTWSYGKYRFSFVENQLIFVS